jgi:hypothetical protein
MDVGLCRCVDCLWGPEKSAASCFCLVCGLAAVSLVFYGAAKLALGRGIAYKRVNQRNRHV